MPPKKRNHYLPELMLRRFQSRAKGKKHWIWQFHHERPPVEVSTKDVAVGQYFYGKPESGVEDALWRQETELAPVLDALEQGERPSNYAEALRMYLWVLAIRTRSVRSQFKDLTRRILDGALVASRTPQFESRMQRQVVDKVEAMLGGDLSLCPEEHRPLLKVLMKMPNAGMALRDRLHNELTKVNMSGEAQTLITTILAADVMSKAMDRGHVSGLSKLFQQDTPPTRFVPRNWQLIHSEEEPLILGDCGVVAVGADKKPGSILRVLDDWLEVYAAISPRTLLVARASEGEPILDARGFNVASVESSYDCFYASKSSQAETRLAARIRSSPPAFSEEEIRAIIKETWS